MAKQIELNKFADEIKNFTDASLKQQKAAVVRGLARSIPDLVAASPVDQGFYAASWQFTYDETRAIIGNTAPYAGVIEYGTRPYTPPIAPLLAWAKRVLQGELGSGGTGQPETDYSPEVWRLAKGTQKKIAQYGMQPKHVLQNMIPTIINNIREEFKNGK